MRSWLSRRLPFFKTNTSLEGIYNYVDLPGLYPTSGQPSEVELEQICLAGFDVVINLAPNSVLENSVVDEAKILEQQGVKYIHMPVDFKAPTDQDFDMFVDTLNAHKNNKVWVHCAANMRVSAFTYRYRTTRLGIDKNDAEIDLLKIWEPFGVWTDFIKQKET